ncbi:Hypothetical protein CINCED_3A004157 [Cinara cedri]|uniref:C2HC/C3H-type domain-containing protein n=1 Tax=Cinara cedri TaxID=506608 RepID=A0A5E4NTD1_9HEMI|nr:Hypothetical protein CINCED_3A004157 [Cinara cedri]
MASSPLRAPAAGQSRLLDMQKKFQQKHLANVASIKGAALGSTTTTTTTTTVVTNVASKPSIPPVPPGRKLGGGVAGLQQNHQHHQQQQLHQQQPRRIVDSDSVDGNSGSDPVVMVDVKGKQPPVGRINSKTATIVKKQLATINGNATKKPAINDGAHHNSLAAGDRSPAAMYNNNNSRLLLPPVVQPTVINALAAGASAADAVASVAAATGANLQKPLVRATKLPPAAPQKPAAPSNRRAAPQSPSKVQETVGPKHSAAVTQRLKPATKPPVKPAAVAAKPAAKATTKPAVPAVSTTRPLSVKKQLSADRPPPAAGMARCPLCARDFAADRLPKHEEVCRRTKDRDRKRKVFDVSKKRLEAVAAEAGVDVASFKKKSQKEDKRAAEKLQRKKDAWRRKHDALVRNVRNARAVQAHLAAGGNLRDLPPELENPPGGQDDEVDSDLVKCPHCGRTFNEASAERHVPLCADRQRNAAARLQNKKR